MKGNNSDRPSLTNSDSENNSSEKKTENEHVIQNECEPNEQLNEPDDYIECPVCDEGALRSQSGITYQVHDTTHLHLQQHTGVTQQNIPVTADLIEEDVEIITLTAVPDTANDSCHADDRVCHREDPSDSQNKTEAQLLANNISKDSLQNSKLQGSPENTILQDSSENNKKSPTVFRIPSLKCNPPDTQELSEMSLKTRL